MKNEWLHSNRNSRQEANTNWISDATKKIDLKLNSPV